MVGTLEKHSMADEHLTDKKNNFEMDTNDIPDYTCPTPTNHS